VNGRYFVLDGHAVIPTNDLHQWSRMFDGRERIVGSTSIGEVHVSTVFLGLDHSFGDGPPLLFETMVFRGEHDQAQWRYTTWDEAESGHKAVVDAITNGTEVPA
jgi:hypothetical protein